MFDIQLRKLREERKLTQKDLADNLNLTQSTIAYYESGKKLPTTDNLLSISKYFNVSTDFLLGINSCRTTTQDTKDTLLHESPLYQLQLSDSELQKLLHYYERLENENREYIIGKMIELYKEQQTRNN